LALPKHLSPVAVPYNINDSNRTKTLVFRGKITSCWLAENLIQKQLSDRMLLPLLYPALDNKLFLNLSNLNLYQALLVNHLPLGSLVVDVFKLYRAVR